jgi:hypothetical protein
MARRNPHSKVVIEKTLNGTPTQKSGAAEDDDLSPFRHRA